VEYIIEDSKELMEEMKFEEMRNKLEKEKARSCNIFWRKKCFKMFEDKRLRKGIYLIKWKFYYL